MNLFDLFHSLLFDYTVRTVALGAATLGVVGGVLGAFALLRQQSLLGDAVAHATLPGVVLAFLLTRSKESWVLMLGAAISGWLAAAAINTIVRRTRLKEDTALSLVLSVFFGLGLMLLTYTQSLPDARQAGLDTFLFGQAATLLWGDVQTMLGLGVVALTLVAAFWKEFKLLTFDHAFAASLGWPVAALETALTTLMVLALVLGLQAVGVVLMSALLVAPAAAARQWTDRLGQMVALAGVFGGLAGLVGALISSSGAGLATGPVVVLVVSGMVAVSFVAAPNRGLLWRGVRAWRQQRRLRRAAVLADLFRLSQHHTDPYHPHSLETLIAISAGRGGVLASLRRLREQGLVQAVGNHHWALTAQGIQTAQALEETQPHDQLTN